MSRRNRFAKRIQPGGDRRQTTERLIRIHLRKVGPLRRNIGFSEDRLNRALGDTGITVDTRFRIDVQHIVIEVESLNGTDEGTVSVTAVDTGFGDDVSHSDAFSLGLSRTGILVCPPLDWFTDTDILSINRRLLKDGKDVSRRYRTGSGSKRVHV